MLPFLKEEAVAQPADEDKEYGALDAIADDLLSAFQSKDKAHLKSALEAFCEYIKEEDLEQDKSLTNEE